MRFMRRRAVCLGIAAAWLPLSAMLSPAQAAAFPERPVTLVVPYPAGGTADVLGRVMAERLSARWRQPVIVENKVGAGGTIGIDAVAKARPDGYQLVLGVTGGLTIAPHLRRLSYDPVKDLAPISLVGAAPSMLAVHPSLPVKSVAELIAHAKAHPGTLTYGSAGIGSSVHIAAELFKHMAGVDMLHVPYKGGAPSVQALLAGEVSMVIENVPALVPHAKAGKVNGLAVTSARRSSAAPDLPTVGDTLPGYQVTTWFGLFAPAGTPATVVDAIQRDVAAVLAPQDTRDRLAQLGIDPIASTSGELAEYLGREYGHFGEVIRQAGIRME